MIYKTPLKINWINNVSYVNSLTLVMENLNSLIYETYLVELKGRISKKYDILVFP